jgi:hypothetical protein
MPIFTCVPVELGQVRAMATMRGNPTLRDTWGHLEPILGRIYTEHFRQVTMAEWMEYKVLVFTTLLTPLCYAYRAHHCQRQLCGFRLVHDYCTVAPEALKTQRIDTRGQLGTIVLLVKDWKVPQLVFGSEFQPTKAQTSWVVICTRS